ncbi:MAG: 16S rRNA (uracil(1498)-N(3))-methyltransferase [Rickettsiales bacterium]
MTRLFVPEDLKREIVEITNIADLNYLANVMRKKISDVIHVFNSQDGEYLAEITNITKKKIILNIKNKTKDPIKEKNIINLIFAPIKHPRMTFLIEKATELGVTNFIPIQTKHSVVDKLNLEKINIHIKEAAEQCERISLPSISPLITLNQLLITWPKEKNIILCNEKEKELSLLSYLQQIKSPQESISIMIGPEGGFSLQELNSLKEKPYIASVHLGSRVLRAETASLYSLSVTQSYLDNFN